MTARDRFTRLHLTLSSIIIASLLSITGGSSSLPHVSDCNFCFSCSTSAAAPSAKRSLLSEDLLSESSLFSRIFPSPKDIEAKETKPNCTECTGCSTQLQPLKAVVAFGQNFNVEQGASPEWIFTADLPDGSKGIIKVWCMPVDKVRGTWNWKCQRSDVPVRANSFLIAQQKVVEDCGLMDVTVRVKLAPVNAIVPGLGLHIWWDGLWMERADGISINQLSYITRKAFVEDTIQSLLGDKLNQTRVVRAAIFDLLTSQCDRHAQNVFINENGTITLIDNLQAMKYNWEKCSTDSIFLPGTQKNEVARFGGNMVFKKIGAKLRRSINPTLLLDYRCYVPGGEVGTNYPPRVTQCLKKISDMTPQVLMDHYGFPFLRNAEVLHSRAKAMLDKGFEWALRTGEPTNPSPKRYLWHQPCCKIKVIKHAVQCGHEWNVTAEFPKGEPLHGDNWRQSYPDPGTFNGGERF